MTIPCVTRLVLLAAMLAGLPACGAGRPEGEDATAVGSQTPSDTLPSAPGTAGLPPENPGNSGNP